MQVGSGEHTYDWVEPWAEMPATDSVARGWAHHDLIWRDPDEIIGFHPGESVFMAFGTDGELRRTWPAPLAEGHAFVLVVDGEASSLWVADNGRKRDPDHDYEYEWGQSGPRVVKLSLDGEVLAELEPPSLPVYSDGMYSPTMVAVDEPAAGGGGDVWVADGYGGSVVHRYDHAGAYRGTLDGSEGDAGAFNGPHGVFIDRRRSEPELLIADRSNHRIQVYDLDGGYKRTWGGDFLLSPSNFAVFGDELIIGDLRARITIVDADDRLVAHLGANESVADLPGFPNMLDDADLPVRTDRLVAGKFNSPHGLTVDPDGNIYVSEWLIGGRTIKLLRH